MCCGNNAMMDNIDNFTFSYKGIRKMRFTESALKCFGWSRSQITAKS